MRFSIKELLIVVTVFAFACISLVRATPIYETLFFSFTLLMILIGICMAIASVAKNRAFWLGFAIVTGAYTYFANLIPDTNFSVPRQNGPEITTQLLQVAFNKIHQADYYSPFGSVSQSGQGVGGGLGGSFGGSGVGGFGGAESFGGGGKNANPPNRGGVPSGGGGLFSILDEWEEDSEASDTERRKLLDQEKMIPVQLGGGTPLSTPPVIGTGQITSVVDPGSFMCIGQCAWALLLGWVGGHFTSFCYQRAHQQTEPPKKIKETEK